MKPSYREISCPRCQSTHIVRSGRTKEGEQRYRCQEKDCETKTFKLSYRYKACEVGKKSQQRWLWYAVDHATNTILAYVFGKRKDDVLS